MSGRVTIAVDGNAVTVRIRRAGACTCGTVGEIHEAECSVLEPGQIDLVLDRPVRDKRPHFWRKRGRR